tara:strand:+ start:4466 stop:4645 length:180 start_codon:yes stop_codon:yes gene_type:complete
MSDINNDTLKEQLYDEAWIDYMVANNLTQDKLMEIEQDSKLGYLPEIAEEAEKRFEELS